MNGENEVTYGGGNVFADLGLADAAERPAKSRIASAIQDVIEERGLTQQKAADLMGIDQPKVSKILRGRLKEFSTEWLLSRLLHMGLDVDIIVHTTAQPRDREGELKVACV